MPASDDLPRPAPLPYTLEGAHAQDEPEDEDAEPSPEGHQPSPERGGPSWRRVLTSAVWVAGCAAFIALLVGLASPPPSATEKESKKAAAPENAPVEEPAEPPEPAPGPPAKAPAPVPASKRARAAAHAALAFDREHPDAHGEALRQLRRGLLAAHGTPQAETLSQKLSARRTALDDAAKQALAALSKRIAALREQRRFGKALRACAEFPDPLRHGRWDAEVAARRAELGAEVESRYLDLMTRATAALRNQEFETARTAYEDAAQLDIPWMAEVANRLLTAADTYIETETARWEAHVREKKRIARRKAFGRLQKPLQQVQDHLAKRHYAQAAQILAGLPDELRAGDTAEAVARLQHHVARLQRVWKTVLNSPKALKGKRLRIHGVMGRIADLQTDKAGSPVLVIHILAGAAKPLEQRLDRLPTDEFIQLARWALEEKPPPETALTLARLHLAEGSPAAAKKLEQARALGADTAPLERRLEARKHVEEALNAAGAERWDQARTLLEAVLDDYGGTAPVILHYKKLSRTLRKARKALDLPARARPYQPAELPVDLRTITLLPETRLGPTPPDDPLDAFLADPLRRRSPVLLGKADWEDYRLAVDYTPGAPLVVLLRVTEPQPGQLAGYLLTLDGRHVGLQRCTGRQRETLFNTRAPKLVVPRSHRMVVTAVGNRLALKVNGKQVQQAKDDALEQGRVGLAAPAGEVDVHRFEVLRLEERGGD